MSNSFAKKLSLMTFLHFFAFGSIIPIFSLYLLRYLEFSGGQVGTILAAGAISSIVSPFVSSFIADKLISSERLFALAHILGSLTMAGLYFVNEFHLVFWGYFLWKAFVGPTMGLADAIVFHHLHDRKKYGKIRVWGTFGWIFAALFFGFLIMRQSGELAYGLLLSASVSMIVGLFTLTIPVTKVVKEEKQRLLPVASLKVLIRPQVFILVITTMMIFFADRFYFYGSSPYLKHIGFPEEFIMPYLSVGQLLEIVAMLSLGWLMARFRAKLVLIAGICANILRYVLLFYSSSKLSALIAIAFHGIAYTFFFSAVFIFLDYQVDKKNRAGVHQLFRIIYLGFGTLFGNLAAGYVKDTFDWTHFWMIPALISTLVLIILLFFPETKKARSKQAG